MPRQYPAGGRYNGQYAYPQQPTTSQYESFFNPIPLDFLQEQLGSRQGQYDQGYAGALAAKEQMQMQQGALSDLAAKNEIIGGVMGNVDKVIDEKYGGNWGKGAKEIAALITDARSNPFWESSKHLAEQQKVQQQFQLNNPNAYIKQDVLGQSTMDPETGQVRGREALTFSGMKRGDYATSIEKQFADMEATITEGVLAKAKGIDGMLTRQKVEEISSNDIKAAAKAGAATFHNNNPDYIEGHMTLINPDTQQKYTREEAEAKAITDIEGQIMDKVVSKITNKDMRDPSYTAPTSAETTTTNIQPSTLYLPVGSTSYNFPAHEVRKRVKVNTKTDGGNGNIMTVEERMANSRDVPLKSSLLPLMNSYGLGAAGIDPLALLGKGIQGVRDLINTAIEGSKQNPNIPLPFGLEQIRDIALTTGSAKEFFATAATVKDQEYVQGIRDENPNFIEAGYNDEQVINLKLSADEKMKAEASTHLVHNYGTDVADVATTNIVGEGGNGSMWQSEIYVDGQLVSGRDKKKLFAKELGYSSGSEEFNKALNASRVNTRSFSGNSPGESIMSITDSDGNSRTVQLGAESNEIQEVSSPSWNISEFIRTGGKSERLKDYTVRGETTETLEDGSLLVPSPTGVMGENGEIQYVYYIVNSKIVPIGNKNMDGRYDTKIMSVTFEGNDPTGQPTLYDDNVSLSEIVSIDQGQAEKWMKTNKNPKQVRFGTTTGI